MQRDKKFNTTVSGFLMATVAASAMFASNRGAFASGESLTIVDVEDEQQITGSLNTVSITATGSIYSPTDTALFVDDQGGAGAFSNTITNAGAIYGEDESGIEFYTDGAIGSNVISNSGVIDALNEAIALGSSQGDVSSNTINNTGAMFSQSDDGILVATGGSGATVSSNTISNSGTIESNQQAIELNSGSGAVVGNSVSNSGTLYSGNNDAIFVYGDEGIISNSITNSGVIESDVDDAVNFNSDDANTVSNTIVNEAEGRFVANGTGVEFTTATGAISGNTITNHGIFDVVDHGVMLSSYEGDITANVIENTGQILADDGDRGIYFYTGEDGFANISGNSISNSGVIVAYDEAIELDTGGNVSGNTIVNSGSLSSVDDDAIYLQADEDITGNTITNSGLITSEDEDGIDVTAGYNASSNVILNTAEGVINTEDNAIVIEAAEGSATGNRITNAGALNDISENSNWNDGNGIVIGAAASNDDDAINGNVITNTGSISAENSGVLLYGGSEYNYGVGYASIAADIVGNQIENTGTISQELGDASGELDTSDIFVDLPNVVETTDAGIRLTAFTAGEDLRNANQSVIFTSDLTTSVDDNTVTNSGELQATNFGIDLRASAVMMLMSDADVVSTGSDGTGDIEVGGGRTYRSISATTTVEQTATVDRNEITNTGTITTYDRGIALSADAVSYAGAYANGESNDISNTTFFATMTSTSTATATAYADIVDNTITNTGSIFVLVDSLGGEDAFDGDGIALLATAGAVTDAYASADTDVWADNDGIPGGERPDADAVAVAIATSTAAATVAYNEIDNTGAIFAERHGIVLAASAYVSVDAVADASNTETVGTGDSAFDDGGDADLFETETPSTSAESLVAFNTITNSGSIIGAYGDSIHIGGSSSVFDSSTAGNKIELAAPAFLGGDIYLNDNDGSGDVGATAVEITTGPSHSVLWHMTGNMYEFGEDAPIEINTNGVPVWVLEGEDDYVFATFDPTVIAAAPQQFSDVQNLVQNALRGNSADNTGTGAFAVVRSSEKGYEGNETSTLAHTTDQTVSLAGLNLAAANGISGQVYLGQADSTSTASSLFTESFTRELDATVAGANLIVPVANARFEFGLGGGRSDVSVSRFVNANIADNGCIDDADGDCGVTLGQAWANGETYATWTAPSLGVSGVFALSESVSVRPSARATYMQGSIDGYTETTSYVDTNGDAIDVATIGEQKFSMLETDLGLSFTKVVSKSVSVSFGGGVVNQTFKSGADVEVTMYGDNADLVSAATQDVSQRTENTQIPYISGGLAFTQEKFTVELLGRAAKYNGDVKTSLGAQIRFDF